MIGQEMQSKLNEALKEAFATCTGFMMVKIELPTSYEEAIVDTQVVIQQKIT